jgi:hypothetical protein
MTLDLVVLYEFPEWQKPLSSALQRREVRFGECGLKKAAFDPGSMPEAPLYFNRASPSAYVRGNTRAVPLCLSLMRPLELGGARALNGSRAFSLELSESAQAALMRRLGVAHPRTQKPLGICGIGRLWTPWGITGSVPAKITITYRFSVI